MDHRLAYGLHVASQIDLPELPRAAAGATSVDLAIERGTIAPMAMLEMEGGLRYAQVETKTYFSWEQAGTVAIEGGRSIVLDSFAGASPASERLLVLGPALNAVVRQRGWIMLHASGVEVDGRCIAFVGPSGMGKSTIAAHLSLQGYPLVADDGIVVRGTEVLPGWPIVKLWPQSLRHLALQGAPLLDGGEKESVLSHVFHGMPLPITDLFVLADGAGPRIEEIPGARRTLELVANSSRAVPLAGIDPAGHFAACAALSSDVRVRRLVRPRDMALLAATAALAVDAARRILSGAGATLAGNEL